MRDGTPSGCDHSGGRRRRIAPAPAGRATGRAVAGGAQRRVSVLPRPTCIPTIRLSGLYGAIGTQLSDLGDARGLTWGIGPSLTWNFPNQAVPRARIKQAEAATRAALAAFDSTVLTALKETEQALAIYGSALRSRDSQLEAQARAHQAYSMAHDEYQAGSVSSLDVLTSEQTVVAADAALAATDAALVRDQIAVFKALGGGLARAAGAAPAAEPGESIAMSGAGGLDLHEQFLPADVRLEIHDGGGRLHGSRQSGFDGGNVGRFAHVHFEFQPVQRIPGGADDAIGLGQQGVDVGQRLMRLRGHVTVVNRLVA